MIGFDVLLLVRYGINGNRDFMSDYYVNHTLYTRDEIDEGTSGDWYVRGREILEKGIAHSLISDMGIFLN